MKAITTMPQDEFLDPDWIDDFGNYNSLPKPTRQCESREFYQLLAFWSPSHMEFRQARIEQCDGAAVNTQIFYFDDVAYAIAIPAGRDPLFFRIGCQHQWKELGQKACQERGIAHPGKCYRVCECPHCGTTKCEDSSD